LDESSEPVPDFWVTTDSTSVASPSSSRYSSAAVRIDFISATRRITSSFLEKEKEKVKEKKKEKEKENKKEKEKENVQTWPRPAPPLTACCPA
jgi:hypothetical protein